MGEGKFNDKCILDPGPRIKQLGCRETIFDGKTSIIGIYSTIIFSAGQLTQETKSFSQSHCIQTDVTLEEYQTV